MAQDSDGTMGGRAGAGWPHIPGLPVVLGVCGQRTPLPEDPAALREAMQEVLDGVRGGLDRLPHSPPLVLASGLAEGAEQMVAEMRGALPLIAISPMPLSDYWTGFKTTEGWARFESLWRAADVRIELPWLSPARDAAARDAQHRHMAALLARHAHLVLGFWDPGGTADPGGPAELAALRRSGTLGPPFLDPPAGGPVVQVGAAGGILLWPGAPADGGTPAPAEPVKQTDDLARRLPPAFAAFGTATHDMQAALRRHPAPCRDAATEARPPGAATPEPLALLVQTQAAAEVAAAGHRRMLFGDWSPGRAWAAGRAAARSRGGWLVRPGALLCIAVALPAAVLAYLAFALFGGGWAALLLYGVLGTGLLAAAGRGAGRLGWRERSRDGDALAAGLRAQAGAAACGVPVTPSMVGSGAADWVGEALHGPTLLALAAALAADPATRGAELAHWAGRRADALAEHAAANRRAVRRLCGAADAILAAFLVLLVAAGAVAWFGPTQAEGWQRALVAALAAVPALAVVPVALRLGRRQAALAQEGAAGRYRRAAALAAGSAETVEGAARELGREAVALEAEAG